MPSHPPPSSPVPTAGDAWSELELLLQELAELARGSVPADRFYRDLLERTVTGLAAAGGAVWLRNDEGNFVCACVQLPADLPHESKVLSTDFERRLSQVVSHGKPQVLPPYAQAGGGRVESPADPLNPTPYLLLQSSWSVGETVAGVIEVFQRPGGSPATLEGYLHFLTLICELAADNQRRCDLQTLRESARFRDELLQFAVAAHRSLEIDPLACELVQEARRLLGVDRVSLVVRKGVHCRVRGVSGVDVVEGRSALVRKLENLADVVLSTAQPLWYQDAPNDVVPQILPVLQDYLSETGTRRLAVLPLAGPGVANLSRDRGLPRDSSLDDEAESSKQPVGALIIEQFQASGSFEQLQHRCEAVQQVAASALQSAVTHSSLPLLFLSRGVQRVGKALSALRFPRTMLILGACLAVGLALWLIPAELRIEGRGKLLPKIRRDLFAAADGVVRKIHTRHGATVKEGELLLELRQSQLDFDTTRVLGEIQTSQQRLAAVQAMRLSANTDRGDGREKYTQLASEEEELKAQLKSLSEQRKILELRQGELEVKSPLEGQVLTWDVAELLTSRPVQRGQVLLTVGDLHGPWELEVELPDDQAGHLLAAQHHKEKLPVSFILPSSLGVVHWGEVSGVALAADADENRRPVVIVTVDFDKESVEPLRPGLAAIPKIHCGSRSLGYVWFHRLWEAVQTWILF